MKIAILGTGIVGRTLADRLHEVGHDIVMGTRDPGATLARTGSDARGQVPFRDWLSEHPKIRLAGMSEAAVHGEVIVNALPGVVTLDALSHIDPGAMEGKVLLDTALPLERHEGLPPTLTGVEELSVAEQIQHAHPGVRVVKSLNTMAAPLMVDPRRVPGNHVVFVTGNDIDAKKTVQALLKQFGWEDDVIHDLGDVRASRGPEMYAYLLFQLAASFGSFDFNIAINRAASTGEDLRNAHEGE